MLNKENKMSEEEARSVTEDTGEEEIEQEQTPVAPEQERKAPTGAYGKVDLHVETIKKNVPDIPHVEQDKGKPEAPQATFTKEDAVFFAQMIWGIPPAIMGDYLTVDEKLVKNWGEQLFSYCERKGINLYDYVFDELGLIMSTGVIAASMTAKYTAHKKELKEAEEKEEEGE